MLFLTFFSNFSSAEINCWQDWLIFSDVFFFLMKSGCIDFVDFVDKLVSRLQEGDQHILRTNHVTWLLAQIIRVELVMNALTTDSRKVALYFWFKQLLILSWCCLLWPNSLADPYVWIFNVSVSVASRLNSKYLGRALIYDFFFKIILKIALW